MFVSAKYQFIGEEEDELDFCEGDTFIVLCTPPGDWWIGKNYGRVGWFPKDFVTAP